MKVLLKVITMSVLVFTALPMIGAENPRDVNRSGGLMKTELQEWKFFDGNTILCTINSAGPYCDYLKTNSSGLFWPRGTTKTAVYTAGIWIIGYHRPTNSRRTAVQDYQTEYQPGPILSTFNTTTNSASAAGDPGDQKYRIYKVVRKDSIPGSNKDYDEWPGDLGAPYIDVNNNGKWDLGIDKPKLWGDQQLWCVYNDIDGSRHIKTGTTQPMGIEIQATYFGFNQPGALGNIMFMRWKVINKSDADYDSVFISMWSDTDMGDSGDDMAGVDTLRKLGYVYNGDNNDGGASGYGDKPPACGFVFFQGPKVKGTVTDTALFEGVKIPGWRNLPATSHAFYTNGGAWTDPPLGGVTFPERAYCYMNGINGTDYLPFVDPITGRISKFVYSGDPVTGTGWLQTTPADVRSMLSAGPFTLAKGDTQEIVGGFVIAQGSDRLNSVSLLRRFTDVAQEAFDVNYVLASPPPAPTVKIGELANRVVLNWGDPTLYKPTETYSYKGTAKDFKFEGYNVYQGESKNGPWKRLDTYDLVDNVKLVMDPAIDPTTGVSIQVPVAYGADAGVKRHFIIEKDYITGNPLVNGRDYYFSVTSYAYNFDATGVVSGIPQVLENSKEAFVVTPRQIAVGDAIVSNLNQIVTTDRAKYGDDAVKAEVIDPRAVTGANYEIALNPTMTSYNITRKGLGPDAVVASNITDLVGSDASPIVDGLMFRVTSPLPGVRKDTQTPNGWSYEPLANKWFTAQNAGGVMQAMMNGIAYPTGAGIFDGLGSKTTPDKLGKVQIRFSNTTKQKAYRYLANVKSLPMQQPKHPSFAPYIIHRGAGAPWQDYVEVPLTAWERDTLNGVPIERQLNVGFLENNDSLYNYLGGYVGMGMVDGKWKPTKFDNGAREVLYIFKSTYSAAEDTNYTRKKDGAGGFITTGANQYMDIQGLQDSLDIMYIVWIKANDTVATFKEGDKLSISPNYVLTRSSKFTITAPKNTKGDVKLMQDQLTRINVFPNPYFANNRAESSVYQRFVSFTNLPAEATIKIFSLTGELVKTIRHNNANGFERWDLRNESLLPVASGMYLAHIEIKDVGNRILKIAIIQPEERPSKL